MKTTVCAIAKNEAPYLIEWVVYYRYVVGFDDIVIYQNDSTDRTADVLCSLEQQGLCRQIEWPTRHHPNPQYEAYAHALRYISGWVGYFDLDEFLVLKEHSSIQECIRSLPQADSISFNWLVFGSSHLETYAKELVTQRFTFCSQAEERANRNFKSIINSSKIKEPAQHISIAKPGARYFHVDGTELYYSDRPQRIQLEDRFAHLNHEPAQVNHYIVKSRQEFKCRVMRGRVGVSSTHPNFQIKNENFSHDKWNSRQNLDIQKHLGLIKSSMVSLDLPNFDYFDAISKEEDRYDIWHRTK